MDDEIPAWVLRLDPTAEDWEVRGHNHWRARIPAWSRVEGKRDWLYVVSDPDQVAYYRQVIDDEAMTRVVFDLDAYTWVKLERKLAEMLSSARDDDP